MFQTLPRAGLSSYQCRLKTKLSSVSSRKHNKEEHSAACFGSMDEENFADDLSFVPYVIHVGDALDVEDTVEVKPTLPVPMVFDEVDRGGPDEVVELEEEQARWGPEKMKNQPTRQKRIHLQKSHSSMGKQLVRKVNFKSQKKENKKSMVDAETNKEVVSNKDVEARRKNGELAETKTMVERLLEDKMRLKKENEALRKELEMKIKNKMEMERKRSKAIMELSRLSGLYYGGDVESSEGEEDDDDAEVVDLSTDDLVEVVEDVRSRKRKNSESGEDEDGSGAEGSPSKKIKIDLSSEGGLAALHELAKEDTIVAVEKKGKVFQHLGELKEMLEEKDAQLTAG